MLNEIVQWTTTATRTSIHRCYVQAYDTYTYDSTSACEFHVYDTHTPTPATPTPAYDTNAYIRHICLYTTHTCSYDASDGRYATNTTYDTTPTHTTITSPSDGRNAYA